MHNFHYYFVALRRIILTLIMRAPPPIFTFYLTTCFLFSFIAFSPLFGISYIQLYAPEASFSFQEFTPNFQFRDERSTLYNHDTSFRFSTVYKSQQSIVYNNESSFQSLWITPRITNETMVVIVMSARTHTERRKIIRETWGNGHGNVYFIISAACPFPKWQMKFESATCEQDSSKTSEDIDLNHLKYIQAQENDLEKEQILYRDMIYTPKHESYHGLVHKLKEGYGWVVKYTKADWILKVDDDTYARIDSVAKYLNQFSPLKPTVVGDIIWSSPVRRDGKWAEHTNYKHETYPPWARGASGYVVSRPVAEFISSNKSLLYEYQGEDTSMGIWLDESPLRNNVDWQKSPAFAYHGNCFDSDFLVIGHKLQPGKIRRCYEKLDEVNESFKVT